MIRTNLYFPKSLHQQLRILSQRENKSMAELVRDFVASGIEAKRDGGAATLLKMAERAKRLKFKGPKDLAINHDYYLYGKGRRD